jgi:hypothetical protein
VQQCIRHMPVGLCGCLIAAGSVSTIKAMSEKVAFFKAQ